METLQECLAAVLSLQPQWSANLTSAMKERGDLIRNRAPNILRGQLEAIPHGIADLEGARSGPGFRIGHSFFCPNAGSLPDDAWYREVIAGEIEPLLDEYFDSRERVEKLVADLLS